MKKATNKEKVMEFAKTVHGDIHWADFVKAVKAATGAKIVREDWLKAVGAKRPYHVDEEYLKANYKPFKDRLCPKAPAMYTYEALQNSVLWTFK